MTEKAKIAVTLEALGGGTKALRSRAANTEKGVGD